MGQCTFQFRDFHPVSLELISQNQLTIQQYFSLTTNQHQHQHRHRPPSSEQGENIPRLLVSEISAPMFCTVASYGNTPIAVNNNFGVHTEFTTL
jgi:hypothetical protein